MLFTETSQTSNQPLRRGINENEIPAQPIISITNKHLR
jgi:hypothetical protein